MANAFWFRLPSWKWFVAVPVLALLAIRQLPQTGGAVIYANVSVLGMMDKDAKDKSNVQYGPADVWGRPTMFFRGIPVKQVDSLLNTESAIT